jgi:hypothetical protein
MKSKSIIEKYTFSGELLSALSENIQRLREKKISVAEANAISRLAGKITSNTKLELGVKFGAKLTSAQAKKVNEFEKLAKANGVTVLKLIYDEHRKLVKELEQLRKI